jgi:hypothetical protein
MSSLDGWYQPVQRSHRNAHVELPRKPQFLIPLGATSPGEGQALEVEEDRRY